jgi:REP element-mobilizing transposase RayT
MQSENHSGHALRKGRVSLQNQVYLVTFVTDGRKHRFKDFRCARLMIRSMRNCRQVKTMAFVVMPDHVHWLVQLLDDASLSQVLKTVKSSSAYQINQHLNRRGKFWQNGFHDHALRKEEAVIEAARYIIANPLRAGLVGNVREYSHWDAIWV